VSLVPRLQQRAAALGREAAAVLRQGRLMAAGDPDLAVRRGRAGHVVFVHGFMASGPVFGPMRAHVEAALDVTTHPLSYRPFDRFEHVALRLRDAVDALGDGPVDLVGHSLGGIVARWYLQELGGAAKVGRLVTLASPHAGTRAAGLPVSPLLAAIRPGSPVLARLHAGRSEAAGVAHTALVAGADRMVTPPSSAAALQDARVRWIEGLGHNEMLFDPRVFSLVVESLTR